MTTTQAILLGVMLSWILSLLLLVVLLRRVEPEDAGE